MKMKQSPASSSILSSPHQPLHTAATPIIATMPYSRQRRRRKFPGLLFPGFVFSCSFGSTYYCGVLADATNGNASEGNNKTSHWSKNKEALRESRTRKSLESVASFVRSANHLAETYGHSNREKENPNTHSHNSQLSKGKRSQQQNSRSQTPHHNNNNIRKDPRNLIVGGTSAPPGRFPYVVSLQLEEVLDAAASAANDGAEVMDVHACGGTLIAPDIVLTAAHCGYEEVHTTASSDDDDYPKQIFYGIDAGAYDLANNDGGGYTVDNMLFEKLVIHPGYTGFSPSGGKRMSLQHDVMVVKMYGSSDQPVVKVHNPALKDEYAGNADLVSGEELVVVGWGDTDPEPGEDSVNLSSILQAATVNYVANDVCEESKGYSSIQASTSGIEEYFEYDGTISGDMMCALGESSQDACQGDSGGGLFRLGDDFTGKEDVQMGIVSWGLQCGDSDFPGVCKWFFAFAYKRNSFSSSQQLITSQSNNILHTELFPDSRVGEHFDWIREMVCELSDKPPPYLKCPTKPLPEGSQDSPFVDINVVIRFDDYRTETAWLLESIPDFRDIEFNPFGTYKARNTVDENNSISKTVSVQSGRWYMLTIMDEFADGFCCSVGEGFFRVESGDGTSTIVDTTPGILWTPHDLRRAFYVEDPNTKSSDYVSIVVTLGMGADPSKFLLLALENAMYESLMLYEIRPFVIVNDHRAGTGGGIIYTRTFRVPIFGVEFNRQRYNIMVYDDNKEEASRASFEVYLGDVQEENLLLAQSGNYGDKNNISRSFVLFKEEDIVPPSPDPSFFSPGAAGNDVRKNAAHSNDDIFLSRSLSLLVLVASFATGVLQ